LFVAAVSLGLLAITSQCMASGFALLEQSAKGMGEAFAGGATETDEPNSIFYNPAGIAFMEEDGASVGLSAIFIKTKYTDSGSYNAVGAPLLGSNSSSNTVGLVPNLFAAFKLSDTISAGIGVMAPFGLGTEYSDDFIGRYHAVKTELATIDISPAIAWQIVPEFLSIGGAVNLQYVDANLTNSVDFGTILMAAGTTPQTLDGFADLDGNDWGIGFSLGILCQLTETTKIGLGYRSEVKHTLEGDVDFTVPATARGILNAIGRSNWFVDGDAKADLTTPASLSLGVAQMLGESFEVKADFSWTGWNSFRELVVDFESDQSDSVTEENWTDTYRISLGLDWYTTDELTLRAGTSYDESPIPNDYRTPRIPGNNRLWASIGASYDIAEDLTIDVSYLHLFIKDTPSNLVSTDNAAKGFLVGEYESDIDVVAAELAYSF